MRKYVPIFYDWVDVTSALTPEDKGRLIDAIVLYAKGGDWESMLQGSERILFPAFRAQMDRADETSENKSKAAETREEKKRQEAQNSTKSTEQHKEPQPTTKTTAEQKNANEYNNNNKDNNNNEKENENENPPEGGKKNGAARRTKAAPSGITLARFDAFWSAYPRKQDKAKALRAFERLNPDTDLLAVIMSALEEQKASPQWRESGGQYIPMASTWLNGRRWEDEPTGAAKGPVTAARYQQRSYTEAELAALQDDPVLRALEGTA